MCGINGIFHRDGTTPVDREAILRMRDAMYHRGPDEQGIYLDRNLGFGHTRLSIIGLETGQQTMRSADGSLCIVYNGETYNYASLKSDLMAKGHTFHTDSDTEVVLQLYAEYGAACVEHMNGLFAFAIWDRGRNELFLARDRLGIKPLYFGDDGNSFLFASEIKSLLKSGLCDASINDAAVFEYFMFRGIAGDRTLFEGVRQLLPGHRMIVSETGFRQEQYWSGKGVSSDSIRNIGDAADRLEELLTDSVRIRLMSEVPLGTFCSGGVDSSLVTAIAAQNKDDPINTFSIGFDEAEFDESVYAKAVSDKYRTRHHAMSLTGREFARLLPELVRLNDEPLHFANSVHIFALSKLAKEYVTVVLTGEGADELFLGYPRYHLPVLANRIGALRIIARPLLELAEKIGNDHRLAKLRNYLALSKNDAIMMNAATGNPALLGNLLGASVPRDLGYRQSVAEQVAAGPDIMTRLSENDEKTYLVSILNRQDKMSMGASVEARVPFIDYRIVEFANGLPSKLKTTGLNTKEIVKQVASKYLPESVVHRRKSGFGVPLADYFRDSDGLGGLFSQLVNEVAVEPYLSKQVLQDIFDEHLAGKADHSEALWTTTSFLAWRQQYAV